MPCGAAATAAAMHLAPAPMSGAGAGIFGHPARAARDSAISPNLNAYTERFLLIVPRPTSTGRTDRVPGSAWRDSSADITRHDRNDWFSQLTTTLLCRHPPPVRDYQSGDES
jgi:hypothetical protein